MIAALLSFLVYVIWITLLICLLIVCFPAVIIFAGVWLLIRYLDKTPPDTSDSL